MEIIKANIPDVKIAIAEEIIAERDALVHRSAEIEVVETSGQADAAGRQCKAMRTLLNDVEKNRKAVTKPIANLKALIDSKAKDFVLPLQKEMDRVGALLTTYTVAERERAAKLEAERQAEIQRKLEDKRRAEQEAEAARAKLGSRRAGLSEMEQAAMAEAEAEQKKLEAEEAMRAEQAQAHKATGTVTRKVVRWEITNPQAVYARFPAWFELMPRRSIINDSVQEGMVIDGMEIWTETVTSFRS